jgi:8-oxo-dGTP pyrophosphatase MutT (NUDIX family)
MPMSEYWKGVRGRVGHDLLLIPSVTAIIYDGHGRVLLVRHVEGNVWVAPGGGMEPHESPADAVAREVWEETRLEVEPVRVIGVYGGPEFQVIYTNGDQVSYVMTVFECHARAGALRPDGIETLELAFFAPPDLVRLNVPAWARVVLPDAFRNHTETFFKAATRRPY